MIPGENDWEIIRDLDGADRQKLRRRLMTPEQASSLASIFSSSRAMQMVANRTLLDELFICLLKRLYPQIDDWTRR